MAVKTKLYFNRENHTVVRAIRVTARNFRNVAEWCKGDALYRVDDADDVSQQRVKVGKLIAQIGDFVVKDTDTGKFFRVKDDVFEASYLLKTK